MRKITLVPVMAAMMALVPVTAAFSAALNPTPTRESKILVDFESDTAVTADPNDAGENLASINTTADFVAEGKQSLKLDLTDVSSWKANYFVIDLPQPVDIKGHQVLAMDVFLPTEALNPDSSEGAWWQFTPHITTTNADDESQTTETWLGMRNMAAGWNHLVFDIPAGVDTKITRLAFSGNTNGNRGYTGAIYVDNIRVYKGTFSGIQPDETLVSGFEAADVAGLFSGPDGVTFELNTDKQFVRDGTGSLKIDLNGQGGGWTSDVARADDLGVRIDAANATAIHLEIFVPAASRPGLAGWTELGYVVVGSGGQVWGSSSGVLSDQWNTLEIALTPEQATSLGAVTGLFLIRNQGANSGDDNPWLGPIYVDNLRLVRQMPPTAGG